MEANNAHVPSNTGTIKMVNLTDYDFIISQLDGEKVTGIIEYIPHGSYFIIKEINWDKDPHIAQFITKYVLEQEVIRRLEKPDYIIIEVPKEHRGIVKEALKGSNVGVLYVGTTQVELKDGQVLDVKLIEQEEDKPEPKIILNITSLDFTDRQIREVHDEDYEILYPAKLPELKVNKDGTSFITVMQTIDLIQEKFNEIGKYPDCVILDIPDEDIAGYDNIFQTLMNDVNVRRIYVRTTLVEFVNGDPLKVKLLSKVEE